MKDEEFVARIGRLYDRILSLRRDEDYVVNQNQMEKLVNVIDFFLDAEKELTGEVRPVDLVPREEHGGVTAVFVVFDVFGDQVKRFCDVMRECSAISIDVEGDQVCISCTIPNVFVRVERVMH